MAKKKKGYKKEVTAGVGAGGLLVGARGLGKKQKKTAALAETSKSNAIHYARTGREYRGYARRSFQESDNFRKRSNKYLGKDLVGRTPYGRKLKGQSAKLHESGIESMKTAISHELKAKSSLGSYKTGVSRAKRLGRGRNVALAGAAGLGAYALSSYLRKRKKK